LAQGLVFTQSPRGLFAGIQKTVVFQQAGQAEQGPGFGAAPISASQVLLATDGGRWRIGSEVILGETSEAQHFIDDDGGR
jgi:hypothetical protein